MRFSGAAWGQSAFHHKNQQFPHLQSIPNTESNPINPLFKSLSESRGPLSDIGLPSLMVGILQSLPSSLIQESQCSQAPGTCTSSLSLLTPPHSALASILFLEHAKPALHLRVSILVVLPFWNTPSPRTLLFHHL